ncbi:hypothetical protein ACN38_g5682 [Penicillium nordicum]|uniref:Uncharacterized protein n=1 Tax=Penicillium nordicum TaxID=229535 RepID=A0A0M8P4L6_9EURO|nr:hypothetical protein ACN38_g5682 [Penicillium nordicum]
MKLFIPYKIMHPHFMGWFTLYFVQCKPPYKVRMQSGLVVNPCRHHLQSTVPSGVKSGMTLRLKPEIQASMTSCDP